ncbi:putative zinc-binding dehydrogenase [Escherichia coli]|uniref:Putative zinc-binding dehydrogenase n=1 Tax=Escherichia coli TaxID=562 RepID=A0A485JBE7_ECOLX|nr:putative zinc-binding dehydrogenase [Escherichia coli]
MMAMMLAKGRGAKRIIGVDMLPERLAMAKQLGVMDHGYLATTEGLPQIIAELTHGGADVALDCSGNAQVAYWRCNPLLTGDGWFTSGKPEKWSSRLAPI